MFCPKCGNQLPEGANFCPKCGAEFPIKKESETPNTNQASTNMQEQNTNQTPINSQEQNASIYANTNYQTNNQSSGNGTTGKIHRTTSELRKEARRCLTEKWGKSALIVFVQAVIVFVIEFVITYAVLLPFYQNSSSISTTSTAASLAQLISSIVSIIIGVPLAFGINISFLKLKRGEEVKILDFWKIGFKNFARSWKISLWITLKMIIIIAITYGACILAGVLLTLITRAIGVSTEAAQTVVTIMLLFEMIAIIVAFGFLIAVALRYILANNIAYDEPNITAKEAVEKSKKLMKGRKGDYVLLTLSFIGWAILTVFTYGIGTFWLLPYTYVTKACFYDHIREDEGI